MKFAISLFFSVIILSCSNKTVGQSNQNTFIDLYQGTLHGAGEEGLKEGTLIMKSTEAWESFLSKLNSVNNVSGQFNSTIDFSKNNVIVAVDRVRSTSGFSIKLSKAQEESDQLVINVTKKGPSPTDMVATAITQPIDIVVINKTNKKIIFVTK
ncbi:protease complex subunit PrcB family protein [Tenacibaculum sp. MEBiC06402]|uniref:protease complex subunit PrcB family protein n=1 Tax=unclassified Tenacibaculum TaxID=2635139 RepID=UPI003B992005